MLAVSVVVASAAPRMRATQAARRRWRPRQDRRALAAQAGARRTSRRLHPGPADGGLARSVFLYARFFPCLRVFLSKITELLARSNRRVLSVTFVSFSGILRGRTLLMVFCGSRDLSMLYNQFFQKANKPPPNFTGEDGRSIFPTGEELYLPEKPQHRRRRSEKDTSAADEENLGVERNLTTLYKSAR